LELVLPPLVQLELHHLLQKLEFLPLLPLVVEMVVLQLNLVAMGVLVGVVEPEIQLVAAVVLNLVVLDKIILVQLNKVFLEAMDMLEVLFPMPLEEVEAVPVVQDYLLLEIDVMEDLDCHLQLLEPL